MANYTIAILGRPNVGKSTLFNRLIGSTHAIVSPIEGVTRDRVYGKFEWSGYNYNLIDTGGYLPDTMDKINSNVRLQADIAAAEADFLLFVVDGTINDGALVLIFNIILWQYNLFEVI